MTQTITSAKTCLNQVPAIFKLVIKFYGGFEPWRALRGKDVLDLGGGKFDLLSKLLASYGCRNRVLDPYNRTQAHNDRVRRRLAQQGAEMALISNVLNVVREPTARREILETARDLTVTGAPVFITVYEGDRTSRGRRTPRGWQANRPTKNYLREIRQVFPNARVVLGGKLIFAENER